MERVEIEKVMIAVALRKGARTSSTEVNEDIVEEGVNILFVEASAVPTTQTSTPKGSIINSYTVD